ncbi:YkgJ family cysteine cluster protein [Acetobacterium bakii]|uniref:YkgJ family cysteine cluster protein n=1 Tax=Acetobacterium bakii TaxID=52689 RepID=A0A0L6TZG4_9FIRM|nr:YkgJ family cysteine cluster protein [Acetobacterium bakii]KNZ40945.1 hypothetical protein AKG39_14645 [Acetobacterium bakii]
MKKDKKKFAGNFSIWLRSTRNALITEDDALVDCGDCNACCTSSYFIHIRPEETKTIAHINKKLLFPAPGLPMGNVLMGYDEQGCCPMLINQKCSIYPHRALTCRSYDCRIFTAAGIDPGDDDKARIKKRTDQWEFAYPTQQDRDEHFAVQAAAQFIKEHAACFPQGAIPHNPSQLAILSIKVYAVFLKDDNGSAEAEKVSADAEIAQAIIKANEAFEARRLAAKSKDPLIQRK